MQEFLDAISELASRKVTPSWFRTRQWQSVAPAIRKRAFFSATVQSGRTLTKMRDIMLDWLEGATETVLDPTGREQIAYKETGLAQFRDRIRRFAVQEGLATPSDFPDDRITNVVGNSRLTLIYSTNMETAAEFTDYQARIVDPDYLNAFPAAEFARSPGGNPEYFRPLHVANTGQIRRWDDLEFWLAMNDPAIGGFGVPWGPWGFNSYMFQKPVSRARAIQLGLVRPNERIMPPDLTAYGVEPATRFNSDVAMDLKTITPEIRAKAEQTLKSRYGPGAVGADGQATLETIRRLRQDRRR